MLAPKVENIKNDYFLDLAAMAFFSVKKARNLNTPKARTKVQAIGV